MAETASASMNWNKVRTERAEVTRSLMIVLCKAYQCAVEQGLRNEVLRFMREEVSTRQTNERTAFSYFGLIFDKVVLVANRALRKQRFCLIPAAAAHDALNV